MQLSKLTKFFLAAGAVVTAAAITVALQTGVINGKPPSMTAPFDVPVPETATTFKITCYDHDGWWNPDDVLFKDDWEPIPTDDEGNVVKTINFQIALYCSDGSVTGQGGSSGEQCAEVYIVVEWNNGKGSYESKMLEVCCPDN